jgi:hypothetical protein
VFFESDAFDDSVVLFVGELAAAEGDHDECEDAEDGCDAGGQVLIHFALRIWFGINKWQQRLRNSRKI